MLWVGKRVWRIVAEIAADAWRGSTGIRHWVEGLNERKEEEEDRVYIE